MSDHRFQATNTQKRLTAKVAKNSHEGRKEDQKSPPVQTTSMRCISLRT